MNDENRVFPAIDPAIFRRQMETFHRMRQIEAEARRVEKQATEARRVEKQATEPQPAMPRLEDPV